MSKIINTHLHLGSSHVVDSNYTEEQLLADMKKNNVDGILVYPLSDPRPNYKEAHDRIYRFMQANPGKVWGVVDMHPRYDEDEYAKEATRCVKELGFVAIKLHPLLQAVNPRSKVADKVFRTANELKVPLIVHTGLGLPNALPSLLITRAMEYPDLKIVISHAGGYIYTEEAIIAAQLCPNIYLEPSWCPAHRIKEMIAKIGADRVMMGSDLPSNTPVEIAKIRSLDIPQEDKDKYLGTTAINLYKLK